MPQAPCSPAGSLPASWALSRLKGTRGRLCPGPHHDEPMTSPSPTESRKGLNEPFCKSQKFQVTCVLLWDFLSSQEFKRKPRERRLGHQGAVGRT